MSNPRIRRARRPCPRACRYRVKARGCCAARVARGVSPRTLDLMDDLEDFTRGSYSSRPASSRFADLNLSHYGGGSSYGVSQSGLPHTAYPHYQPKRRVVAGASDGLAESASADW